LTLPHNKLFEHLSSSHHIGCLAYVDDRGELMSVSLRCETCREFIDSFPRGDDMEQHLGHDLMTYIEHPTEDFTGIGRVYCRTCGEDIYAAQSERRRLYSAAVHPRQRAATLSLEPVTCYELRVGDLVYIPSGDYYGVVVHLGYWKTFHNHTRVWAFWDDESMRARARTPDEAKRELFRHKWRLSAIVGYDTYYVIVERGIHVPEGLERYLLDNVAYSSAVHERQREAMKPCLDWSTIGSYEKDGIEISVHHPRRPGCDYSCWYSELVVSMEYLDRAVRINATGETIWLRYDDDEAGESINSGDALVDYGISTDAELAEARLSGELEERATNRFKLYYSKFDEDAWKSVSVVPQSFKEVMNFAMDFIKDNANWKYSAYSAAVHDRQRAAIEELPEIGDWFVQVYDGEGNVVRSWELRNCTERVAEDDAASYIAQRGWDVDWTIARIFYPGRKSYSAVHERQREAVEELPEYPDVYTRNHMTFEWVELGEGKFGDYDEDNPDDVELLRFDFFIDIDLAEKLWIAVEEEDAVLGRPQDCSYCTSVPVSATDEQRYEMLILLMDGLENYMVQGLSPKKACEKLSWANLDWLDPPGPPWTTAAYSAAVHPAQRAAAEPPEEGLWTILYDPSNEPVRARNSLGLVVAVDSYPDGESIYRVLWFGTEAELMALYNTIYHYTKEKRKMVFMEEDRYGTSQNPRSLGILRVLGKPGQSYSAAIHERQREATISPHGLELWSLVYHTGPVEDAWPFGLVVGNGYDSYGPCFNVVWYQTEEAAKRVRREFGRCYDEEERDALFQRWMDRPADKEGAAETASGAFLRKCEYIGVIAYR